MKLLKSIINITLLALVTITCLGMEKLPYGSFGLLGSIHNGYQPVIAPIKPTPAPLPEIHWDWQSKCKQLKNILIKEQFDDEIDAFIASENKGFLANPETWLENKKPDNSFFSPENVFQPYVLKLAVKPNTEIAFHGDIHGDVHSLNAYLVWLAQRGYMDKQDPLKITKENFYLIFLGDYTDRGKYGAEVIFTICRLKRTNPTKVLMARGNHEDLVINMRDGFKQELHRKFGDDGTLLKKIHRMYNYLPVAIYMVCNNGTGHNDALLCDHGGVEVGFNSNACNALLESSKPIACTLLGNLLRKTNTKNIPQPLEYIQSLPNNRNFTPTELGNVHFCWNDFDVINACTMNNPGRGWECDKPFTDFVHSIQSTKSCTIRGVFRGHQHGDAAMMAHILNTNKKLAPADTGVAKLWQPTAQQPPARSLWDGIVCTFCVSPNTGAGNQYKYNYDAFGILKTAQKYQDWKLTMHRIETKM